MMKAELCYVFFFFQAEDGIRDLTVTGVQTCALPIYGPGQVVIERPRKSHAVVVHVELPGSHEVRSEEHTSELQSQSNLVCRLLLEKKKKKSAVVSLRQAAIADNIGSVPPISRGNSHP